MAACGCSPVTALDCCTMALEAVNLHAVFEPEAAATHQPPQDEVHLRRGEAPFAIEDTSLHTSIDGMLHSIMVQENRAIERLESFKTGVTATRAAIVSKFGRIRDAVNAAERSALADFDSESSSVRKALEMEVEAAYVKRYQVLAQLLKFGDGLEGTEGLREGDVSAEARKINVDVVVSEALVCHAIRECWKCVWTDCSDEHEQRLALQAAELEAVENTKLRIGNVKKELQAEIRATKQLQFELSLRGPMSACSVAAVCKPIQGVHVTTFYTRRAKHNRSLAISRDGCTMAVLDATPSHQAVLLYALPSGDFLRELGVGDYVLEGIQVFGRLLLAPTSMCFNTDSTSLIVCDSARTGTLHYYGRKGVMREIAISGEFLRSIGEEVLTNSLNSVAANKDSIVATHACSTQDRQIAVFDYATGALVHWVQVPSLHGYYFGCSGIRFMPDGEHVIVAVPSGDKCIVVKLAGGEDAVVRTITGTKSSEAKMTAPADVCLTSDGIAVCSVRTNRVTLVSLSDGKAREFGHKRNVKGADISFREPISVAYSHGKLYVLDSVSSRIQMFD